MAYVPSRRLERVVLPATEPLTLAEAKLYLRVDGSSEDTLITQLITAARETAEAYLRRSLITQQWKLTYEEYFPQRTYLSMGPVTSIVRVSKKTKAGAVTDVSTAAYYLGVPDQLVLTEVVAENTVEVVYGAGYGTSSDVPQAIRQGMLAHIAAMYDGRSEATALPESSKALYQPYRGTGL
ncbi:MAG: head-tail connector protein [Rickettsiales bacterium]